MKGKDVLFSSEIQTYSTPNDLFDWLDHKYHFTLDVCADRSNHKCKKYFTESDNGLLQSWEGETCFCNPPYSHTKDWIYKAYDEKVFHHATSVVLIPARTDVSYWHDIIAKYASEIIFLRGRLKFSGNKNSAPFPSAVIYFTDIRTVIFPKVSFMDYRC